MSGATGAIYGIRLLEVVKRLPDVEAHVIISPATKRTLVEETDCTVKDVEALGDVLAGTPAILNLTCRNGQATRSRAFGAVGGASTYVDAASSAEADGRR